MPLTYTFLEESAATVPLHRARRLLSDVGELTDEDGGRAWNYSDEEVQGWIDVDGFNEGVAKLAQSLAIKFSQEPVKYRDDGGVEYDFGPRIATLKALAKDLRSNISREVKLTGAAIFIGGQLSGPSLQGLH